MSDDLIERLDPELKGPVRELMGEFATLDDIPAARAASSKMMEAALAEMSPLRGVEMEDALAPGPAGAPDVTVRTYRPEGSEGSLPALLWIHGGGYVLGRIDYEDPVCARLAVDADCLVVSVEYRLAPENPYPAPMEDCYAALRWTADRADELRIDRSRIAIGGASAGGGLAAGLALLARDQGEVDVLFQLLVYPMLDDSNTAPATEALPDTLFWTRENNLIAWRSYLGCEPGGDGVSCYASAVRAVELEGLPPAYIAVGDQDLFAGEDIEYARRLVGAGVSTELHVYPGGCHGFDMLVPDAAISRRLMSEETRALRRALHPES